MSDNGVCVILIFFQEIIGARKCYLIDLLVNFIGRYAQVVV